MTRWEYRKEWACDGSPTAGELAALGADGWELAGVMPATKDHYPIAVFKRPLPPVTELQSLGIAASFPGLTMGGGMEDKGL